MGTKVTRAQLQERVNVCIEMLAERKKRAEIIEYGKTTLMWGVGARSIDVYLKYARAEIRALSNVKRKEWRAQAMLDCTYLYRKNIDNKDYAGALAVRKELNKLQGLYATPASSDEADDSNPDDVDAMVDKLIAEESETLGVS